MYSYLDIYTVSDRLLRYLLGPKGHSYDVCETSFQEALGTAKPRWDWLAERVSPKEITNDGIGYPGVPDPKNWLYLSPDADGKIPRPELDTFSLAMVGGGKVSAASDPFDYPWRDLPQGATVVDVGGGVGGFLIQLLSAYPHLKCICQDRAEVIKQARENFWPQTAPKLLQNGHVDLQVHDFFDRTPCTTRLVRHLLHRHSLRPPPLLTPKSRTLICDQVMNTTYGCAELATAPYPLPANYGYYTRYCHLRDISLMTSINGIERTPLEFKSIIEKAGLRLEKIWETRSLQ
ncbi:hypothetical protein ABVK25_008734 [Lepraria finkii]|uniref:O-methyltransferase C-terminal domain-containing protein n=1 Tax=Lepraria finkii TaxID=1340010 RepID=A0ABR4B0Q2_9LECA